MTGLLALVFVSSWSLKTVHTLVMHHAHHDVPVCAAAYEGSSKHFHDERYQPDDCSVCAFIFAVPEIVSVSVLLQPPALVAGREMANPPSRCYSVDPDSVRSRGPPFIL